MKPRATVRLALHRESVGERRAQMFLAGEYPPGVTRPRTRAECEPGPYGHGRRPCPWTGCRHHLALEVVPTCRAGQAASLDLRREDLSELHQTCALDVADLGGLTLEETGAILGVSRERVRQIETGALRKMRRAIGPEWADGIDVGEAPATSGLGLGVRARAAADEEDAAAADAPAAPTLERRLAWDLSVPDFGEGTAALATARAYAAYTRADVKDESDAPREPRC